MSGEDLYKSINALDDVLIERSEKTNTGMRWRIIAACAVLILGLSFLLATRFWRVPENDVDYNLADGEYTENSLTDGEYAANNPGDTAGFDDTPISYGDLKLAEGVADEDIIAYFSSAGSAADIESFDEERSMARCSGIVEGVITDMYRKQYSYRIQFNKFGEDEIYTMNPNTVVYEIQVDKTWYGEDLDGRKILIEDEMIFADGIFTMREGGRYVIPFYETEDVICAHFAYLDGDITRDSTCACVYPYHPQIEVTEDNCYIVSDDWTTLVAGEKKEIIDVPDSGFYRDKMKLVTAAVFAEQMQKLTDKIM